MKVLRNCFLLTAIFISAPYVFCWQGNTPEAALEEIVTTEKIEVMAKHLPVKVEEAIAKLDDKQKKQLSSKLLPKSIMQGEGGTFAKSDDGTQWEIKNKKGEIEGTVKLINSFVSGSDALVCLQFAERSAAEKNRDPGSIADVAPQLTSEPHMMLVSMRLEGNEWRIVGFGPWQQKSLEEEDLLHGIISNPREANEAVAASNLRTLNTALVTYSTTYPEIGFPARLEQLVRGNSDEPTAEHASLLEPSFGEVPVIRDGYEIRYTLIDSGTTDPETKKEHEGQYRITAKPVEFGKTGSKSFFTDQSCIVRFTTENREANENDDPL